MLNRQQKFGSESEKAAAEFLKKQGYKIVARNYRTRAGEIDIIARDKEAIAFIEVKSRNSKHYGHPKWAVTKKKQYKISMVALSYLKSTRQNDAKARFDVVSILNTGNHPRIELIKNAFELAYR